MNLLNAYTQRLNAIRHKPAVLLTLAELSWAANHDLRLSKVYRRRIDTILKGAP